MDIVRAGFRHWLKHWDWATHNGTKLHARYPNNLLATALQNNVFGPLAKYGGFDLFVLRTGRVRNATTGVLPPPISAPEWNGGYDALQPNSTNWRGEPNNMILFDKGEQHSLQYNESDPRWRNSYGARKWRNSRGAHVLTKITVQTLLHMALDQQLCNQMVQNYSARTQIKYAYKMRLRPDMAFVAPMPPLHTLDFGNRNAPNVLVSSGKVWPGGNQDTFGVGEADVMDVYFDRLPYLHTDSWMDGRVGWTTEGFLEHYLKSRMNATIREHDSIQAVTVRTKGFVRGLTAGTSELAKYIASTGGG
jgi:hypothetical protein